MSYLDELQQYRRSFPETRLPSAEVEWLLEIAVSAQQMAEALDVLEVAEIHSDPQPWRDARALCRVAREAYRKAVDK